MQVMKHTSKGIHPGFETQGRRHQKSKIGVSVVSRKRLMSLKSFLKKFMENRQIENLHPMLKDVIATIIIVVHLNTTRMIKTRLEIFTGSWDTF